MQHPKKNLPVSKTQIINFIFHKLNIIIPNIQSLGNGIVYAHLLFLYDKGYDISRVYRVFNIKIDSENNKQIESEIIIEKYLKTLNLNISVPHINTLLLKITQSFLKKKNILFNFDIEKLSRCRLQDNLEMIQWIIRMVYDEKKDYGYENKRTESQNNSELERSKELGSNTGINITQELKSSQEQDTRPNQNENKVVNTVEEKNQITKKKNQLEKEVYFTKEIDPPENEIELQPINEENVKTTERHSIKTYKSLIKSLEEERNFYYTKLLKIEKIIRSRRNLKLKKKILEVLWEKRL